MAYTTETVLPLRAWTLIAENSATVMLQVRSGAPVEIWLGTTEPDAEAEGLILSEKNGNSSAVFSEGAFDAVKFYARSRWGVPRLVVVKS